MMMSIQDNLLKITEKLPSGVKLVAVSKFHPLEAIQEAYNAGQRLFGESRPQELQKKVQQLEAASCKATAGSKESPAGATADHAELCPGLEWHFIGHLQTNKLKMVLPYVSMVESVDSLHLLQAIDTWGRSAGRRTRVLLEMHIAAEETKQGFTEEEILDILFNAGKYPAIEFCGLMGMATNTDDEETIRADFARIADFYDYTRDLFSEISSFTELSIGMSADWPIAVEYGATIVRVGTAIFGERTY